MTSYLLLANISAFDVGVNYLRDHLFSLAFILIVLGIWESAWKGGNDPKAILGILLKTTIIVVLLAFFPVMMKGGKEFFNGLKESVNSETQNKFNELLDSKLPEVEPKFSTIGPYIASLITAFLQYCGTIGVEIVKHFQTYAIGCLTAVSPLMIGLLALSYTQAIGVRFLMTSLCVVMWSLGFVFADLFLSYLGTSVFAGMLASGTGALAGVAASAFSWPAALGAMLVACLVPTFLYIATPMAIAKLMAGANAGTAMAWGGLSNMASGAQYASRGSEAIKGMQAMRAAKQATGKEASAEKASTSTGGTVERPPNPIA
ncbi:MAG: hypothetical protein C5B47_02525 [Verrucomicrobia bacterium]|nr:MAG: hypothetical protein C5B47_02525 [Verrucomicrobiota bacterium]